MVAWAGILSLPWEMVGPGLIMKCLGGWGRIRWAVGHDGPGIKSLVLGCGKGVVEWRMKLCGCGMVGRGVVKLGRQCRGGV